ncbi:hypothetical protein WOLCODRAFT_126890 [Wolfiporia cocos MD-104 SS10]|uniref:Rad9-domain-containing protein n=1 Tax=Wolfiporia cocos (strain MD-104) TaxID=742152 RepID=A0A2H3JJQ3_WOLCO|nr:hypothetical protein WOLCODRAFT_126890 [Wolfiporia cocos MD-104 SS10]
MQATLDSASLKQVIRALTCLARYGEYLIVYATPDFLTLSATNSSKSAFCRFTYKRQFFSRYRLASTATDDAPSFTGQLLSLLSILKHKTLDKTVEKCELSITEGGPAISIDDATGEEDSLESKLIVRLHCTHGIVKTHRLPLMNDAEYITPTVPVTPHQSKLNVSPRAVMDVIEHFPAPRGGKIDPCINWTFGETEVQVQSVEMSLDPQGKAHMSTILSISAEEFDAYNIDEIPATISFHLKEFSATVAYADAAQTNLDIAFTIPANPLFVDIQGDLVVASFAIGTTMLAGEEQRRAVPGVGAGNNTRSSRTNSAVTTSNVCAQNKGKKRARENDEYAAAAAAAAAAAGPSDADQRERLAEAERMSMPPPSMLPQTFPPPLSQLSDNRHAPSAPIADPSEQREPLFYPSSQPEEQLLGGEDEYQYQDEPEPPRAEPMFLHGTQLTQAEAEAIRASGLGIEHMTMEELHQMLEEDGEEVDFGAGRGEGDGEKAGAEKHDIAREASLEIYDDDFEMAPTQPRAGGKMFRPLFDD